jgi:hypothetical protein
MFLGLLESSDKSDHILFTPLCPAYMWAVYTREYSSVTHLHVYAGSTYAVKSEPRSDGPADSSKSKKIHIRPEMNEIWS